MSTIKVWHHGTQVELDRRECIFVSRTGIVERQKCQNSFYLSTAASQVATLPGRGFQPSASNEELAVGKAIHAGIDSMLRWMMWGEPLSPSDAQQMVADVAADTAEALALEIERDGIIFDDNEDLQSTLPEVWKQMAGDVISITDALLTAFGRTRLPSIAARFDLISVEEEVAWLVGRIGETGPYVVCLSRLDAVVRGKQDRLLYTLEFKTTKEIYKNDQEEKARDTQGITQSEAIFHLFAEEPGGSIYFNLVKGKKFELKGAPGTRLYGSPFTSPFARDAAIVAGEQMSIDDLATEWEWFDDSGKRHTRGKYWSRHPLAELGWTVKEWMEMIPSEFIARFVGETEIITRGPIERARWKEWLLHTEEQWQVTLAKARQWALDNVEEGALTRDGAIAPFIERARDHACHYMGRYCWAYAFCNAGKTITDRVSEGRWKDRDPNHPQEFDDSDESEPESKGEKENG